MDIRTTAPARNQYPNDTNIWYIDRRMYIKFVSAERIHSILQDIQGQQEYEHDNGEISVVTVQYNYQARE
jgi:hypothetical protein